MSDRLLSLLLFVLLLVALLPAGCTRPHRLDPKWSPLVEVVERPDLILSEGASTTVGTRVFVANLKGWLRRYPVGSVEREALLLHEREHALRQLRYGVGDWIARYLNDTAFMWREEQLGWAQELLHLRDNGRPVLPEAIAVALSEYQNFTGAMVAYPDALAWVGDVLSGRWSPPEALTALPE